MKNIILIVSMLALITGTSCKNKEKTTTSGSDTNSTANTTKVNSTDKKARLVISFKSIGTGIDGAAYEKMEKFVKEHPKNPQYDVYIWGREGETDCAFSLKEIKNSDQAKFIDEIKASIGNSDRVTFKENEVPTGKLRKKL